MTICGIYIFRTFAPRFSPKGDQRIRYDLK